MRPGGLLFLMPMAVGVASPGIAAAQERTDEIVVTAAGSDAAIRDFVEALTPGSPEGQLSRFETRAACPQAAGFTPAQAAAIVARMRRVAVGAGVPVARAGCRPNILVVATADNRGFLSTLRRKHAGYFAGIPSHRVDQLVSAPGPVAAWQIGGPELNGDGMEIYRGGEVPVNRTTRSGSRLQEAARPQFGAALVVIEAEAMTGLTTTQVADYAAVRAYARVDPAKLAPSSPPTILKAVGAAPDVAVPVTLTAWDLGFLRALSAAPRNLKARADRSVIAQGLRKNVADAAGR
jgi:hypothetical protein